MGWFWLREGRKEKARDGSPYVRANGALPVHPVRTTSQGR